MTRHWRGGGGGASLAPATASRLMVAMLSRKKTMQCRKAMRSRICLYRWPLFDWSWWSGRTALKERQMVRNVEYDCNDMKSAWLLHACCVESIYRAGGKYEKCGMS